MVKIYALRCIKNDFVYIGCTKYKLSKRFREHRCLLRNNKHSISDLQKDWLLFGEQSFEMIDLESVENTIDIKRSAEKRWMKYYSDLGKLYHQNIQSFEPPLGAQAKASQARMKNGYRHSSESNLKRSLAQLGIPKGHGAKISATKRAKLMR